jgi:RNA polymerase sigma-70 factor (ECF subfamily)
LSDGIHQIVDCCLAGDQVAMRELVDRYKGPVFGLCFRMLNHRQDAEDVAQEALIRMLKSLKTWDRTRDFEPWLLAIAGNRCRTALSKRMRRPAAQQLIDAIPESNDNLQAAEQLAEEVQLGLSGLRDQYREAFVLFHQHELTYEEIATALERPLGTVKTWIHRARREIIDFLRKRESVMEPNHNEMR